MCTDRQQQRTAFELTAAARPWRREPLFMPIAAVLNACRDRLGWVASRRLSQPEIYQVLRRHQSRQPSEAGQQPDICRGLGAADPLIRSTSQRSIASPSAGRSFSTICPVLCRDVEIAADAFGHPKPGQRPARSPQVTSLPASIEPPDGYWFGVAFHRHRAQRSCPPGRSAECCHH